MTKEVPSGAEPVTSATKEPLSHAAIITAAMHLADEHGIDAVTMRRLASDLGVQAMSLYHHVESREAILDGLVERAFAEIELPPQGVPWREAMTRRAKSARAALLRHPWAVPLLDSRSEPGPATLRHHDAVLGYLRAGGFSVAQTVQAFAVMDAYIYGFVVQERAMPLQPEDLSTEQAAHMREQLGSTYPNLAEVLSDQIATGIFSQQQTFDAGLGLLLDGFARQRDVEPGTSGGKR